MTLPNPRPFAVAVASLAIGCGASASSHANAETGGSFDSEGGVDASTGADGGVEVSIGQLPPLCATAPLRNLPDFGDARRFRYQRVLHVGSATPLVFEVPDGGSVAGWIPFEAVDGDGAFPTPSGLGALTSILGVVPSTVFASEEREGYDMVRYESDPGSAESEQRLSIEIAVVEGAGAVALDPSSVAELDAGRALLLNGGGADGGVVRYALCEAELAADVHRFDLDAGTIAFHTRPAIWGINSGFTVLAEGVVSGKTLSVDSYWDLGYASGDMGTGGLYGVMPSLFVQAEDGEDGRCALVVEANPMDNGQSFVARWLGCDGSTTEVLTVLGSQFEPGAGTSAQMKL